MQLKDILFTPIFLLFIYALAYYLRPILTTTDTKKYFIPALTFKIIGAILVGLIYHYFYKYGDTLRYHFFSEIFYKTMWDNPWQGIRLFFTSYNSTNYSITYALTDNYFFNRDIGGFFMLKITAFLGLLNMHSYYTISCLYAFLSFFGLWMLFKTMNELYQKFHLIFFLAIFCIPSVVFWGSGILKDTITFSALGWMVYSMYHLFIKKDRILVHVLIILISSYVLTILKIYILLCFTPPAIIWIISYHMHSIRNKMIRLMIWPGLILFMVIIGLYLVNNISTFDPRYSIEKIEQTMEITAKWITYTSGESGSVYTLGNDFDLSLGGIIRKLPAGINVTLFRPYLWEVNNSVMFIAAIESFMLLMLTAYVLYKVGFLKFFRMTWNDPTTRFMLIFALAFAFAVGISTYNFGTLVRYKIPGIPFYVMIILIALSKKNQELTTDS